MKHYTSPGCKFNPEGIQCDPNGRHCDRCGHNPAVAAARLQKIQKATAGYPSCLTTLQTIPPERAEIYMLGNWGSTATIEG